jgi:hypothetical protein
LSSEYEYNVSRLLAERSDKLQQMQNNSKSSAAEIDFVKMEIETLESLYDNYNRGMGYFRRAYGGREGLREVRETL